MEQRVYINGREYKPIPIGRHDVGSPFLISRDFKVGAIDYGGIHYDSIPLLYDVVQNELVTTLPNTTVHIALVTEHIQRFMLGGRDFEYIAAGGRSDEISGVFEVLYRGEHVEVLVRRSKVIAESNHASFIKKEFVERNVVYIRKEHVFYPVKNKKSLLEIFSEDQALAKEIRGRSGLERQAIRAALRCERASNP